MAEGDRWGISTRLSVGDPASLSHEVQLAACRQLVAREGGVIVLETSDTESGLVVGREGYQRHLAAARAREITCIGVYRLDRFGRDEVEAFTRIKELERLGVRVVAATQDISDPFVRGVHVLLAGQESRTIAARVKATMLHLAATRGIRPRPLFGYRLVPDPESPDPLKPRRMWAVDEAEADLLRRAADRYLGGEPLFAVAAWCRQQARPEGGPYLSPTGKPIGWHLMRSIFGNPAYVGRLEWNRESNSRLTGRRAVPPSERVAAEGAVPAIFPEELFRRLQNELARRATNKGQARRTKRPLTSLLYCLCGARMYAAERPAPNREYYKCRRTEDRENCPPGVLPARPIEWIVAEAILSARVSESELRKRAAARRKPAAPDRRPALLRAIERQKERTKVATMGYIDGVLSPDAYRTAIADIDRARLALEQELADLGAPAPAPDAPAILAAVAALPSQIATLTLEERRQLFHAAVRRAVYEGASVLVEWTPGFSILMDEPSRRFPKPSGRKAAQLAKWVDSRIARKVGTP